MSTIYLVDANVWLPCMVLEHVHRDTALRWFDRIGALDAGMCRLVQAAVVRLLANPAVMSGGALAASEAWKRAMELMGDERVAFCQEPAELEFYMGPLLRYPIPAHRIVNDAYLTAFAIAGGYRLVTFDRGFRQFQGLDLELLGH